MKILRMMVLPLAACVISAVLSGCNSRTAAASDRVNFKGGPMPANIGKIIADRAQMSKAQAAQHPAIAQ